MYPTQGLYVLTYLKLMNRFRGTDSDFKYLVSFHVKNQTYKKTIDRVHI